MYKLGRNSKRKLATCHPDMQKIINEAITISQVDFGISEGFRNLTKQKEYFDKGLSKIDGISRLGKHNYFPSMAVDIYIFVNGRAIWEEEHLSYVAGIIMTVAEYLYKKGEIKHVIRWGGNFDMDGELLEQSFDDRPHLELVNPK